MAKVKTVTLTDVGDALDTPFITPVSKRLIRAAWGGDLKNFVKYLLSYVWFGTRDYTVALIILSFIVAASKDKQTVVEGAQKADEQLRKVTNTQINKLFAYIGSGDGKGLEAYLKGSDGKWFKDLFEVFLGNHLEFENDENGEKKNGTMNKLWGKLVKQAGKMTKWTKKNEQYIKTNLCNAIETALGPNIANSVEERASSAHPQQQSQAAQSRQARPTEKESPEEKRKHTPWDELRKIKKGSFEELAGHKNDERAKALQVFLTEEIQETAKFLNDLEERILNSTADETQKKAMHFLKDFCNYYEESLPKDFKSKLPDKVQTDEGVQAAQPQKDKPKEEPKIFTILRAIKRGEFSYKWISAWNKTWMESLQTFLTDEIQETKEFLENLDKKILDSADTEHRKNAIKFLQGFYRLFMNELPKDFKSKLPDEAQTDEKPQAAQPPKAQPTEEKSPEEQKKNIIFDVLRAIKEGNFSHIRTHNYDENWMKSLQTFLTDEIQETKEFLENLDKKILDSADTEHRKNAIKFLQAFYIFYKKALPKDFKSKLPDEKPQVAQPPQVQPKKEGTSKDEKPREEKGKTEKEVTDKERKLWDKLSEIKTGKYQAYEGTWVYTWVPEEKALQRFIVESKILEKPVKKLTPEIFTDSIHALEGTINACQDATTITPTQTGKRTTERALAIDCLEKLYEDKAQYALPGNFKSNLVRLTLPSLKRPVTRPPHRKPLVDGNTPPEPKEEPKKEEPKKEEPKKEEPKKEEPKKEETKEEKTKGEETKGEETKGEETKGEEQQPQNSVLEGAIKNDDLSFDIRAIKEGTAGEQAIGQLTLQSTTIAVDEIERAIRKVLNDKTNGITSKMFEQNACVCLPNLTKMIIEDADFQSYRTMCVYVLEKIFEENKLGEGIEKLPQYKEYIGRNDYKKWKENNGLS